MFQVRSDIVSNGTCIFKITFLCLHIVTVSDHYFILFLDKRVALFKLSDEKSSRR